MASKDKKELPPFYVVRRGAALYGEFDLDKDRIWSFPEGERIRVDFRTARRLLSSMRAYWAFLNKVVKATECAPNAEALHETIKLMTGYTTPVQIKGMTVMIPKSIAFCSMSEDEFREFFDHAVKFIAENYGTTKEDVANA